MRTAPVSEEGMSPAAPSTANADAPANEPASADQSPVRPLQDPEKDVVGGLRVCLRQDAGLDDLEAVARLDQHVKRFIEANWAPSPRRFLRLRPLAYALLDQAPKTALLSATEELAERMEAFLFGDATDRTADVLTFAAASQTVAAFLHGPPEEARALQRSETELEQAQDDAKQKTDKKERPRLNAGDIGFQAVFDARHSVVLASVTAPVDPAQPARMLTPAEFAQTWDISEEVVHTRALAAAVDALNIDQPGGAPLIYCPVEYGALATPQRMQEFLELCAGVPERVLGVKIVNAPNFPQNDRVRDITRRLTMQFRFVDWEVAAGEIDANWFAGAGLHSITLAAPRDEADQRQALTRFLALTAGLRSRRLRVGVRGVGASASLRRCVEAGVDFVSGPGVSEIGARPFTPRRIPPEALPVAAQQQPGA